MKQALHYKKLEDNKVQCFICPRRCVIKDGETGFCKARQNKKGILYSMVYAAPCSVNIDPIEKKPLYHFLPGTKTFSVGTTGCNLRCKFCQNWQISQALPSEVPFVKLSPNKLVEEALQECKSIAYTYTEPAVFYEYVLDSAKLARKKKLKNVCVTNGFIEQDVVKEMYKYIDGVNVDLKSFNDKFYREITGGWIKPVLAAIKTIHKMGVWLEITNLIIPKLNDDMNMFEKMCKWIKDISPDIPLHISRFHPDYLMKDYPPTGENILLKAGKIAKKHLNYVYIGNIDLPEWQNTYCPKCKEIVIERRQYDVVKNNLANWKCKCGEKIAGIWK